jgi:hypothetical protein
MDVAIPASSKSYLTEVGLPSQFRDTVTFGPEDGALPRLDGKRRYLRIGMDDFTPFCLDEERGGCVVSIQTSAHGIDRYINRSVEYFGECLVQFQRLMTARDKLQGGRVELPREEDLPVILSAEKQFVDLDPTAFANGNDWWPVIFEQMKVGFL